jgi:hypothetical protein
VLREPPRVVLNRAFDALAALLREEYPPRYSLTEIAEQWGWQLTPEQVDAIRQVEQWRSTEPRLSISEQAIQSLDVEATEGLE